MARLVYGADLHGNLDLYRAAGEAAFRWGADAVIFGGDLCPETHPFARMPQAQADFLLQTVAPLVRGWKHRLPSLRVFAIPGNDDFQTVLPALEALEQGGLIENLHRKAAKFGGYSLVGLSFVPPTPFSIKDFERRDLATAPRRHVQVFRCVVGTAHGVEEIADFESYLDSHPSIEEELHSWDGLCATEPQRMIAVIHCPPANTRCDVLFDGTHVGSKAVRRWIERYQPLLTLHGHIHESPGMSGYFSDRIGTTSVVNPGSDKATPHLVFLDLEDLDVMEHSLYGREKR
jgi:Icc-related predicted phosphoesterase